MNRRLHGFILAVGAIAVVATCLMAIEKRQCVIPFGMVCFSFGLMLFGWLTDEENAEDTR